VPRNEEMTVTIRAVDAATATLARIQSGIGNFAKAGIKNIGDLAKQFLGFKSVLTGLVGGGLLAKLATDLGKGADQFELVFSGATQAKLDKLGTSINRVGSTFKGVIGQVLADNADKIVAVLDGIGKWITDNQESVLGFFRLVGEVIGAILTAIKWTLEQIKAIYVGAKAFFESVSRLIRGGGGYNPRQQTPEQQAAAQAALAEAERQAAIDQAALDKKLADEKFQLLVQQKAAFEAVKESSEQATEKLEEIIPVINQVQDEFFILKNYIATQFSGGITDAFFEIIDGTKSVAQAFGDMTASILRDLGRLLIQQGLLNLLGGLLGGGSTIPAPGGSNYASSAFGSLIPRASGGPMSAGGTYLVGENGPEIVRMGNGGGRVSPGSDRGITIVQNISGGDPQQIAAATKAAVYQALENDRQFRARIRTA
jgi:hypothetical protein